MLTSYTIAAKALRDFYFSTKGNNWLDNTNWLDGDPCKQQWYGVKCNVNGDVTSLCVADDFKFKINLTFSFKSNDL